MEEREVKKQRVILFLSFSPSELWWGGPGKNWVSTSTAMPAITWGLEWEWRKRRWWVDNSRLLQVLPCSLLFLPHLLCLRFTFSQWLFNRPLVMGVLWHIPGNTGLSFVSLFEMFWTSTQESLCCPISPPLTHNFLISFFESLSWHCV